MPECQERTEELITPMGKGRRGALAPLLWHWAAEENRARDLAREPACCRRPGCHEIRFWASPSGSGTEKGEVLEMPQKKAPLESGRP